jgi:hypothetical protein
MKEVGRITNVNPEGRDRGFARERSLKSDKGNTSKLPAEKSISTLAE